MWRARNAARRRQGTTLRATCTNFATSSAMNQRLRSGSAPNLGRDLPYIRSSRRPLHGCIMKLMTPIPLTSWTSFLASSTCLFLSVASSIHRSTATFRSLERPIAHRYNEIEEFPKALNNSQMWNWSSRLFITEAKQNLTAEAEGGPPARYTQAEIDALEKTLKEHETWLAEWVAKQRQVPMNQNPVILTSEMRARAKTLENHLQKLWKKKVPLKKKSNGSQGSSSGTPSATGTSGAPPEETKTRDEL